LTFDIAQIGESLPEQIETGRRRQRSVCPEDADSSRLAHRLRLRNERRKREADGEKEPDYPHGHLGCDVWRESSRTPRRAPA